MQVVEAEARSMGLFGEEEDDLSEVVADEALIRIPAETAEGEADKFLQQQEVLLFVGVKLMERVQLV